jgi:hypothetical protein
MQAQHARALEVAKASAPSDLDEALHAVVTTAIADVGAAAQGLEQVKAHLAAIPGGPAPTKQTHDDARTLEVALKIVHLLRAEMGDDLGLRSDLAGTALVIAAHAVIPDPQFRSLLLSSGFANQA